MKILLDTIAKVNKFNKVIQSFTRNVYLESGRYCIDGKSLMGVYSLNLSEPIRIIYDEDDSEIAEVLLSEFEV